MIELLAGLGVGGAVAVIAGFVGHIMGFARGTAQRNITALFSTGQADALWCLCGHALPFHRSGGRCRAPGTSFAHCSCRGFVGDPARNPASLVKRGELDL